MGVANLSIPRKLNPIDYKSAASNLKIKSQKKQIEEKESKTNLPIAALPLTRRGGALQSPPPSPCGHVSAIYSISQNPLSRR
uniref:Uncharacterized protein n=1 Tax=Oryza punctata TaxID=4537 RepID=A0A0E0JMU7_ORYPU